MIYNWNHVPAYPDRYVLIDIVGNDTLRRNKYLVHPFGINTEAETSTVCYEKRIGDDPGGACLQVYIIDARMADSLNTLDKLIEHNKEICLGTRTFQTMDEMREADFTVTYP